MTSEDNLPTVWSVEATGANRVRLAWSDGTTAEIDLTGALTHKAFQALLEPNAFAGVMVGEWGHGLAWPSGEEMGADALWRDTLVAIGRGDARAFLDWRLKHGLSLTKAADALGISRRMVAYYSNGEKPVPKPILLACRGWEVDAPQHRAA